MVKNCSNAIDIQKIISHIHADLQAAVDPFYKIGVTRFFKEQVKVYGVRTPKVRRIAANYAVDLKSVSFADLLSLCEKLLQTGYMEDATIALALVYKRRTNLSVGDVKVVERWLNTSVSNWATCDDLSVHILGYCIEQFPEIVPNVRTWVTSGNRWVRRAAAVSFIFPVRRGNNFDDVVYIADKLLHDQDDLVQKGCGWMLKEASKSYQQEVIAYIEKHRKTMPRTMLRYAIELMPREVKQQLMRK